MKHFIFHNKTNFITAANFLTKLNSPVDVIKEKNIIKFYTLPELLEAKERLAEEFEIIEDRDYMIEETFSDLPAISNSWSV